MAASRPSLLHSLLPLPLPSWETPRESPQQEKSSCAIFPPGVSHLPHNPTTTATPRRTRLPALSPQPSSKLTLIITLALLALRATDKPQGGSASPPPKSVRRPWGWLSVHHSNLGFLSRLVVVALPGLGPLRAPRSYSQAQPGGRSGRGCPRPGWLHSKKNIPGVRYRQGVSPNG